MAELTIEQQRALALARARQRAAQAGQAVQKGNILPISKDSSGNVSFDPDAGIFGYLKRAFTLPGEAMRGEVPVADSQGMPSDQAIGRAMEMGSVVTPMTPGIRAGEQAIPGVGRAMRQANVEPPSAEALKMAAKSGYDEVRDAGVDYTAQSVVNMADDIARALEADGVLGELAPKTFKILDKLRAAPEGSVAPISGVEAARRSFGNAAKDFANPTEQLAAKRAMAGLEKFVASPPEEAVVAGAAAEAGGKLAAARGNYAAFKRSEKLTGLGEAADIRAAVANSGQNADNATRQRLASLLLKPKDAAGFDGAERAAIEQVARGVPGANPARTVGNILGGGGGLGTLLTGGIGGGAGAILGNAPGAVIGATLPPAIGAGLKQVAAALTKGGLSKVDRMTRKRSPLYEEMLKRAAKEPDYDLRRALRLRALLAGPASTDISRD